MAVEAAYLTKLKRLIRTVNNDVINSVLPIVKRDYVADSVADDLEEIINKLKRQWESDTFVKISTRMAQEFVNSILEFNNRSFNVAIAKTFGIDAYSTPELKRALELSVKTNSQLIRSLTSEHINQVANMVYANVMAGYSPTKIESNILAYGVSYSRAKLIARDQTAKVMGDISRVKQQSGGFQYFKWDTSHDERVRETHRKAAKARTPYGIGVYKWDDLPLVGGRRLAPTQDYQCRCVALPIADWEVVEYQKRKRK